MIEKGEIYTTEKGKPQCRFCHEHAKDGMIDKGCNWCKRIRRILEGTLPKVKKK